MDDLEPAFVEALRVGQVTGEAPRDGDVDVREARDRSVGEREAASLAKLVETVLRAEAERHPRERARELAVDVRVHEVGVQERRPVAQEVAGQVQERDWVDVRA